MSIESVFGTIAADYDRSRKQLIPCYDDFYDIATEIVPYHPDRELRVLDIGAGTGILSDYFAAKYPRAQFTLLDISPQMLDIAKQRLADKYPGRISFVVLDYGSSELRGRYDLVVSALSIHHLAEEDKAQLFKKIHRILEPGGFFINADQVLGENEVSEKLYQTKWLEKVRANGVDEETLLGALERMKEDKMSTLTSQLTWLKDAGFTDVTTWYQHYSFTVFSGRKHFI